MTGNFVGVSLLAVREDARPLEPLQKRESSHSGVARIGTADVPRHRHLDLIVKVVAGLQVPVVNANVAAVPVRGIRDSCFDILVRDFQGFVERRADAQVSRIPVGFCEIERSAEKRAFLPKVVEFQDGFRLTANDGGGRSLREWGERLCQFVDLNHLAQRLGDADCPTEELGLGGDCAFEPKTMWVRRWF